MNIVCMEIKNDRFETGLAEGRWLAANGFRVAMFLLGTCAIAPAQRLNTSSTHCHTPAATRHRRGARRRTVVYGKSRHGTPAAVVERQWGSVGMDHLGRCVIIHRVPPHLHQALVNGGVKTPEQDGSGQHDDESRGGLDL